LAETKRFVAESSDQYIEVFGPDLFSMQIMRAVEPALKRVADALVRGRRSADRSDLDSAVMDWQSMCASKANAASGLIKHLKTFGQQHAL